MSEQWQHQSERGNQFGLNLMVRAALTLGRPFTSLLLFPVATYFVFAAGEARRASASFLQRIYGRAPTLMEIWRHFYSFARVTVDRVFFLAGKTQSFNLEVQGLDKLSAALDKGGVLLLLSHFGSFDVMRNLASHQQQVKISVVMDRESGARFTETIAAVNADFDAQIIDANCGPVELIFRVKQALDEGHVVGLMGDRLIGGNRTLPVELLGSSVELPITAYQLALATSTPLFVGFGVFLGGVKYRSDYHALLSGDSVARRDRGDATQQGLVAYTRLLEQYALDYPYNWFNFYDFWADT